MRRLLSLVAVLATIIVPVAPVSAQHDSRYTPTRINKAIELLEQGEPIYFQQVAAGGYELGLELAQTYADLIGWNAEHAPFSAVELRAFMQGLIDGGPTRSGHRTPAVIAVLPAAAIDEAVVRANAWMIEQALSAGAHGVMMVHARTPEAVHALVQAARYPHRPEAPGIGEGLRGSGGQTQAAPVWGISPEEYLEKADVWPFNPEGEILLGLKVEDRWALERIDELLAVPGIAIIEAGPADLAMSFGVPAASPPGEPPYPQDPTGRPAAGVVIDARARIHEAATRSGVIYSGNSTTVENVIERIDAGIRFFFATEEAARVGREHTGRAMP